MERGAIRRRAYYVGEDDDGFASIHEFSGNDYVNHHQIHSLRNVYSINTSSSVSPSPRSAAAQQLHSPHFLQSCALCRNPLARNRDIFMYRGDTPFCSEECREEQIEMDEAQEKKWKLKTLRTKNESKLSSSKAQNYPFRSGPVAAA